MGAAVDRVLNKNTTTLLNFFSDVMQYIGLGTAAISSLMPLTTCQERTGQKSGVNPIHPIRESISKHAAKELMDNRRGEPRKGSNSKKYEPQNMQKRTSTRGSGGLEGVNLIVIACLDA